MKTMRIILAVLLVTGFCFPISAFGGEWNIEQEKAKFLQEIKAKNYFYVLKKINIHKYVGESAYKFLEENKEDADKLSKRELKDCKTLWEYLKQWQDVFSQAIEISKANDADDIVIKTLIEVRSDFAKYEVAWRKLMF